jgi:carbamoyltransferase
MAGGVALNCVANSVIWREGPFDEVWVQPASGDSGTALGAALRAARDLGDPVGPMAGADLGRAFGDDELAASLDTARVGYERPADVADAVAEALADDGVVAWFQGASEYGPRALGHRSLLADPAPRRTSSASTTSRAASSSARSRRWCSSERAARSSTGRCRARTCCSPIQVRPAWRQRIPAVVHVDGTARIQTINPTRDPLVAGVLAAFERLAGVPVVVNTSLNTAGRPIGRRSARRA